MTHRLYFFAEQAYFSFVKDSIDKPILDQEKAVERGSICVIALTCALEGVLNKLLKEHTNFRNWDDLRLKSKVETMLDFAGLPIDWGRSYLHEIADLIALRNWLVHFKENNIGLVNSAGQWIKDNNKLPKRNPDTELSTSNVRRLYTAVIEYCVDVTNGLGVAAHFEYLQTEDYEAFYLR